ncbi:MAG: hypothetical protein JNL90_11155 [Planctomycetes bacterium]|nr:hypothetical protein [Planctomycetota bacterium]
MVKAIPVSMVGLVLLGSSCRSDATGRSDAVAPAASTDPLLAALPSPRSPLAPAHAFRFLRLLYVPRFNGVDVTVRSDETEPFRARFEVEGDTRLRVEFDALVAERERIWKAAPDDWEPDWDPIEPIDQAWSGELSFEPTAIVGCGDDQIVIIGFDAASTVVAEYRIEAAPKLRAVPLRPPLRFPAIGTVGDAEWLEPANELLLLLDRERALLWGIDLRDGTARPLADATRFPAMATMRMFNAYRPKGGPPLVCFFSTRWPDDDHIDPSAPALLLVDDDGDDRFDREATEAERDAW